MKGMIAALILVSGMVHAGNLRYEGFSDEEIKEIQAATSEMSTAPIIMISGATDRCACEEGPTCTGQLWTTTQRAAESFVVPLSRIDGHWTVSRLHRWNLRYHLLTRRSRNLFSPEEQKAYQQEWDALRAEYPCCPGKPSPYDPEPRRTRNNS
jgi:hypothetical protein